MKIVFIKSDTKNHICDNCGKQFNWDKDSCYYGKLEYKNIEQRNKLHREFCSNKCYVGYINLKQ